MKTILFLFISFLSLSLSNYAQASEQSPASDRPFEVRIAPISLLFSWLTVETAYSFSPQIDAGINGTYFGGDSDQGGAMFSPNFDGNSVGVNFNYNFVKREQLTRFYTSLKVNYEYFESVGHSSRTIYSQKGPSVTAIVGVRSPSSLISERLSFLAGLGVWATFYSTEERDFFTKAVTKAKYQDNGTIPYFEVKIAYSF